MSDKDAKCKICRSDINVCAKKCLKCGSRQDWLRFFDVGNTSLSLIIAAFSVLALGADNISRLSGLFSDPEKASVTITVTAIHPKKVSIFIDNDGPGSAVFSGSGLCPIAPTAKAITLWVPVPDNPDQYTHTRYPTGEEVAGRYIYSFGEDGPSIIKAGENRLIDLEFSELLLRQKAENPSGSLEIKSYCFFAFQHENGEDDGAAVVLDSHSVTFFALDRKDVQNAISGADRRLTVPD